MLSLQYITSNTDKIRVANKYLVPLGIELVGRPLELEEIQSESIAEITAYKAKHAFNMVKKPLLVNDAGWSFSALHGFPGAYMKFMNKWLTAADFIALMQHHENKSIVYSEVLCFTDGRTTKSFTQEIIGTFLGEEKGNGLPSWTLVSLREDKKSIAQCWEEGTEPTDNYPIWEKFANWYKGYINK